jgi:hypothetical protein
MAVDHVALFACLVALVLAVTGVDIWLLYELVQQPKGCSAQALVVRAQTGPFVFDKLADKARQLQKSLAGIGNAAGGSMGAKPSSGKSSGSAGSSGASSGSSADALRRQRRENQALESALGNAQGRALDRDLAAAQAATNFNHGLGPESPAAVAAAASAHLPYDAHTAILGGAGAPAIFPPNDMAARTGADAANALETASRMYASLVSCTLGGGGQQASAADVARVQAAAEGKDGYEPLGAMIAPGAGGPYLEYMHPTTIQPNVAGVNEPWNNTDKALAFLDPEGAAKLAKALSLSAVPQRFNATEQQEDKIQAQQRAAYWRKLGKLDLTPEELLNDRPVWVPTADAIRRSVIGNTVDRTFATQVPMRFLYTDMLMGSRLQTPRVAVNKDTVIQEPLTPGMDVYLATQACGPCLETNNMEPL